MCVPPPQKKRSMLKSFLVIIGDRLRRINGIKPFIRKYLNPVRELYWQEVVNKRRRPFLKYGQEALRVFHETAEQCGVEYTLAFGSVLGAIREHGFIKHDLDIDTFMSIHSLNRDFYSALFKKGFKWYCNYSIAGDKLGREDTLEYKGCHLDIFYLYKIDSKFSYCCDFLTSASDHMIIPRKLIVPINGMERRLERFEKISVFVPENAEEFCEFRYGPSYMIPNSSWTCRDKIDSVIEWPEVASVTVINKHPQISSFFRK